MLAHSVPLSLHPQRRNEPVPDGLGENRVGQIETLSVHDRKG
jgi:hypothetical protein